MKHMNLKLVLLLPLLVLSSCNSGNQNNNSSNNKYTVYLDYSEVTTPTLKVKVGYAHAYSYTTDNYSFSLSLSIKNLSSKTQKINFSNVKLLREETGTSYTVISYNQFVTLDSEIEGTASFQSTIPTSLEDKYYFSIDIQNINYKVFLYETPDSLREDLTITYKIDSAVVHTETIKKGRTISNAYVYDEDSHQYYASTWKDSEGKTYTQGTKIEQSTVLSGTIQPSLEIMSLGSDTYAFIEGIHHVHADGKVVVLERYQNKEVCLGNYAIKNNANVREIYLPATLHYIYGSNFYNCPNLRTIYFAGTMDQWNAIPKPYAEIGSNVNIVYNTPFIY